MAYETKENEGSLFANSDKQKATQPDYTGKVNILCPHCGKTAFQRLAGWLNKSDGKKSFIGLKLSIPRENQTAGLPETPNDFPPGNNDPFPI